MLSASPSPPLFWGMVHGVVGGPVVGGGWVVAGGGDVVTGAGWVVGDGGAVVAPGSVVAAVARLVEVDGPTFGWAVPGLGPVERPVVLLEAGRLLGGFGGEVLEAPLTFCPDPDPV